MKTLPTHDFKLLIGGRLMPAAMAEARFSFNPGNGEPAGQYAYGDISDASESVRAARQAFDRGPWPGLSPRERARILLNLADLLQADISQLAYLESLDSGGLYFRTRYDVMMAVRFIRRMANYVSHDFPWKEELPKGSPMYPSLNYILHQPVGVCAAIIPWNFPLLMAVWKITMATLAGNTIIVKPSPETPLSALFLGELIIKSGFPDGVINVITGPGKEMGEYLVRHPDVDMISFTGSVNTGKQVMKNASETLKRISLELGGKSANIILPEANFEMAMDGAVYAAFLHSGQVCESGSRLFLPQEHSKELLDGIVKRVHKMRVGYQLDPAAQMGPLINRQHQEKIEQFIASGLKDGAAMLTGGENLTIKGFEKGFYTRPVVFGEVSPEMKIAREEIFGPVLTVFTYKNEDELVELANQTNFGLAAGIWSTNLARARGMAEQLRVGTVWINDWHVFHEFGPFGGYKQSGIGREFGKAGLESFLEIKHVHLGTESEAAAKPGHRRMVDMGLPLGFEYNVPVRVISGPGSILRLAGEKELSGKKFLVLTDPGVRNTGLIEKLYQILGDNIAAVFDSIPQDSGLTVVDEATRMGKKFGANAVLSVGGGSVIDTGKAVAVTLRSGRDALEIVGFNHLSGERCCHVAIPTTAGTGSEVTGIAVLKNEKTLSKAICADSLLFPDLAVLDAAVTVTLPALLTISTAMDALTHAIEAYVSTKSSPVSDALALEAISLIMNNFESVVAEPRNIAARHALLTASNMAGMAINMARVGLVHAISHAIGTVYGAGHGTLNAILLPHVIRWNALHPDIAKRYSAILTSLGITDINNAEAGIVLGNKISALLKRNGHPVSLNEIIVKNEENERCAILAFDDLSLLTNPRPVTDPSVILDIIEKAWSLRND